MGGLWDSFGLIFFLIVFKRLLLMWCNFKQLIMLAFLYLFKEGGKESRGKEGRKGRKERKEGRNEGNNGRKGRK